jgi:hypothetical protein
MVGNIKINMGMEDKQIEGILEEFKESYAPWEMEEGNYQLYETENMIKFGRKMYQLGLNQNKNKDGLL